MDQNKNTQGQQPRDQPNQDQRQGSQSNQSWNDQPASTPTRDQLKDSREETRGTGSHGERNRSSSDDDSFDQSER